MGGVTGSNHLKDPQEHVEDSRSTVPMQSIDMQPAILFAFGVGVFLLYQFLTKKHQGRYLPPGPKGYPVIGNLADVPTEQRWLKYAEMGRKWGGIIHISLLGQPMIILNSAIIMDEFDKAGSIYSDRPVLQMGGELVGYDQTTVLLRYGPRFRTFRKHISRHFGPGKPIQALHPIIAQETHCFLKRVFADYKNLNGHIRKMESCIILRTTYGYDVKDGHDGYVDLIERANSNFTKSVVPGAFQVDVLPFLKYLPEWLPGTGFLSLAREWKKETVASAEVPYSFTVKQKGLGAAPPSLISNGLEGNEVIHTKEYIHDLKWSAASVYGAGADTTVASKYSFFLAMILFPEVQKRAQAEIDTVVGSGRLPTFADRPNLPYVNALVSEVLRWHSTITVAPPHTASQDGYINNYFIPKGTLILANLWGMSHDPGIYPDPFVFNPERFLGDAPQRDPRRNAFGFGRRTCPGRTLAEASIFSCVVSSLAVFSIEKELDEGIPITPEHVNTDGAMNHPKPFKCFIKPRSERAYSLVTEIPPL